MKAREAESPEVVSARIRQYEDYGVAQEYQTWVRSVTPKMEPLLPERHPTGINRGGRGGGVLAVSKLGVKGHGNPMHPIQTMSGTDDLPKKEWSTGQKVGAAALLLGVIGGAAYGIKRVIG
jgi:hypothetical protein